MTGPRHDARWKRTDEHSVRWLFGWRAEVFALGMVYIEREGVVISLDTASRAIGERLAFEWARRNSR